jgi:hypothetical protein
VTWETRNPLRNPILSSKPQKELQKSSKGNSSLQKESLKAAQNNKQITLLDNWICLFLHYGKFKLQNQQQKF